MPQAFSFIKKETPTQVFSCDVWEIFKNTFSTEYLRATGSVSISSFHNTFLGLRLSVLILEYIWIKKELHLI